MPAKNKEGGRYTGGGYICQDLGEFKRIMDKMRTVEDKIILRLNCELPTNSFSKSLDKRKICEDIQKQLVQSRKMREDLLQKCVDENREVLRQYQNEPDRIKELRTANANLRLLKEESGVEEIIRIQADKTLTDRCRKELLS